MKRWFVVAAALVHLGCTSVLGIDGDYDDQADAGVGGSGATGAAGGTGAAAGAAGGGGIFTGTEICDNGIDDDDNGKTDCEDPQCTGAGYSCVDPAPTGFVGPVDWYADQKCAPPFSTEHAKGGIDVTVPPGGSCPTCACGSATGERCGVDANLYDQLGCGGKSKAFVFVGSGTCVNTGDQVFGPKSVKLTGTARVVQGSCAPSSAGEKSFQNPSFTNDVRACRAQPGGGCAGSQICAPPNGENSTCIAQDGDVACPGGFSKRLLFRGWQDSRDCGACACEPPTGTCPSSAVPSLFDSATSCSQGEIVLSSNCSNIPLHPSGTFASRMTLHTATNVTCKATGGAITGTVTPNDPVTVCCRPVT